MPDRKNTPTILLIAVWLTVFFAGINQVFSQENDPTAEINKLKDSARSLRIQGDYTAAREELNQAISLINEKVSQKQVAELFNKLGVLGIYEYRFPEALSSLQRALTIYREIDDEEGVAECLNNVASIYVSLNNFEKAKENYKQSLKIRQSGSDLRKLGISYNNLGVVFNWMSELDSALFYFNLGQEIWENLGDSIGIGITLSLIGGTLREQGDLEQALSIKKESIIMLSASPERTSDNIEIVTSEIGLIFSMLGRNEEAISICEELCFGGKETYFLTTRQDCCNVIYQAYSNIGNYQKALESYRKYTEFKDSILGTQTVQEITRLELNYAFDQIHRADSLRFESERQLQQQRINQQRMGLITVVGILFLLGLLVVAILRGKKRSEELLLNILPAAVAKELKEKGKAQPKKYELVSVIFADIKGFTQISENLSPEKLLEEINVYFTAFDRIMEKYEIEKIKTIGDCYMAVSGLPIEKEDHAVRAANAALDMQGFVRDQQSINTANNRPAFEIRIGIHSGPVVAGIVGTKKFQFDIWGDTVNTANRLETNCETGKVNISEDTYKLVKDNFNCEYRGEINTKGKGIVSMYYIYPESKK